MLDFYASDEDFSDIDSEVQMDTDAWIEAMLS